jgi:hypothetical protein
MPRAARRPSTRRAGRRLPPRASTKASVSSCRTTWPRPAPMASRMATSFRRPAPRASSMFARFRQAITSTRPDIVEQQHREGRELRTVLGIRADGAARQARHLQRLIAVLGRERVGEVGRERPQSCLGGVDRHVVLQPAEQDEGVVVPVAEPPLLVVARESRGDEVVRAGGEPELGREERRRAAEPWRRHAHYREGAAVQADGASDQRGVRAVPLPPRMARHDDRRAAGALVSVAEPAPHRESRAEHGKVIRRYDRDECAPGRVPFGDSDDGEVVRDHLVEDAAIAADVLIVRPGERPIPAFGHRAAAVEADEPSVALSREGAQKQLVDDGEDGRVRADPQRKHRDGGHRERGRGAEHPQRVPQVSNECAHVSAPGPGSLARGRSQATGVRGHRVRDRRPRRSRGQLGG